MKSINQIRIDAATLLESRDNAWTQGAFRRKNDKGEYCYCMIGACREVAGYYDAADAAYAYADDAADAAADAAAYAAADAAAYAADAAYAAVWNDTPGRTKEEVIQALRKGIE